MNSPLRDLGLAPSGTILVLPKNSSLVRSGGTGSSIMDYVWLILTPLTVLWNMLSSFVTPATVQTNSTPTGGPSQGNEARNQRNLKQTNTGVRSDGNVARLRNLSDDDDETNTWNGNSTQQQ